MRAQAGTLNPSARPPLTSSNPPLHRKTGAQRTEGLAHRIQTKPGTELGLDH